LTDKEKVRARIHCLECERLEKFSGEDRDGRGRPEDGDAFSRRSHLKKPAASAFELPAGMTKYTSIPAMMQAIMMKQLGGALAPAPVSDFLNREKSATGAGMAWMGK